MANAYSKGPVSPTFTDTYTSQFTGLPLEYIGAALQSRQNSYDHYLQGETTLQQGLMGIQAATPSDAAYLKSAQTAYNKQLGALADTDLTSPSSQRALKELGSQIAGDRTLQGIQATHSRMGELQSQAKKLQAEGKYHASQAVLNRMSLERYEAGGGAGGGQSLDAEDFQPELNAVSRADEYYKVLKPEEAEGLGFLSAGEDGKIAYSSKHGGVSNSRAMEVAKNAASDWINTGEGRQVMRDGLAQGMNPQQAMNHSLQFFANRGRAAAYSTSSSNLDVAYNKVGDLRRTTKKAKKEEVPTWMPAAQFKPELGERPKFDREGNVVTNPGAFESMGAAWDGTSHANLSLTTRAAASAGAFWNSFFGDTATKQGLDDLIGRKTSDLQKGLQLRNQAAAAMGKPQVTGEDFYHTKNVWQPSMAPVITSSKAHNDAQAQIVDSGVISGMVLHDEAGAHHYNDLIKEGDKVEVTTDPNTAWSTPYSNHTIGATITSKDGTVRKAYIDAGAQYDYMDVPQTAADVKAKNTRLEGQARSHGYAKGIEWKWDEKTHRAIPVGEKEGVYDPTIADHPLFRGVR